MTEIPKEVYAGAVVTVSCSVTHTCSSHPPEFSWSVPDLAREATQNLLPQGTWKTTSTIKFLADGGDGEKSVTCTATYWRGRKQSSTTQLMVKGQWKEFVLLFCHKFSFFDLMLNTNRITEFRVKTVSPSHNPCLSSTNWYQSSWCGHLQEVE